MGQNSGNTSNVGEKTTLSEFLRLVNPVDSISEQYSRNTDADVGPPPIPTAPVPKHWWHSDQPHPMYPLPAVSGPPADFGGVILPNPDGRRVMADTERPGDRVTNDTKLSTDNFYGRPKGDISNPRRAQLLPRSAMRRF